MGVVHRIRGWIGEQATSLLRSGGWGGWKWWSKSSLVSAEVDYDLARELYINSNDNYKLGGGFCRRIIDAAVEFIGTPRAASEDETLDDWLNSSIEDWWGDALQQLYRNALRDSKCVVRLSKYNFLDDPLISAEDDDRIFMEVIEPERVKLYFNPFNANILEEARITHHVPMVEPNAAGDDNPVTDGTEEIHEIIEVIDRQLIRYFDVTKGEWITELEHVNEERLVPVHQIFNEWDSTLGRGQSDLEAPLPFIKAFHDVMLQSLQAHAYHSVPKVKFKLNDIDTFLRNNFPDSFDPNTDEFSGQVQWKGKEILFLQSEEDAGFVEAKSILDDSKTLMEFLFDCICIAAETPAWLLMRTEQGAAGREPADTIAFVKRVERKRLNFKLDLVKVFKMALVMSGRRPIQVKLAWDATRPEDEVQLMNAFQLYTMGAEVAAQRGIISDSTYRVGVRRYLPWMKTPDQEEKDAEDNKPLPEMMPQSQNGNIPIEAKAGSGGANE